MLASTSLIRLSMRRFMASIWDWKDSSDRGEILETGVMLDGCKEVGLLETAGGEIGCLRA